MFYYQVDVIEVINGNGPPPSLVLELLQAMPEGSACEAIKNKAPRMVGWDAGARMLADISDYVQASMISSGNWKKGKAPKFQRAERPWIEARKRPAASASTMSITDMHKLLAAHAGG